MYIYTFIHNLLHHVILLSQLGSVTTKLKYNIFTMQIFEELIYRHSIWSSVYIAGDVWCTVVYKGWYI